MGLIMGLHGLDPPKYGMCMYHACLCLFCQGDAQAPYGSVHPRYKQAVGARLAAATLSNVYGKKVPYLSPRCGVVLHVYAHTYLYTNLHAYMNTYIQSYTRTHTALHVRIRVFICRYMSAVGSSSGTTVSVIVSFEPASIVDGIMIQEGAVCPLK